MAVHTPRALHTFDAFSNHSYRLLWSANFFSYISRWMQMTLLSWLVLELTDSPWYVALVGFFSMAPMLVIGVFGGVLADRLDKRKLLVSTQASNLAAVLLMAVLLFTGQAQFWHTYIIVLVGGIGWALDMPSRRSAVLDLLGRARVTNAIALDSVGMHSSKMLGPALAGVLITLIEVKGAYILVTLLYLTSLLLMWSLRLPARAATGSALSLSKGKSAQNVLRNLAEGFQYVRSNNTIMAVIFITILMNLLLFSYMQMIPVVARNVLQVGPGLMGVLIAADGLGALAGAVLIASAGSIGYQGRIYLFGSLLSLVMLLLFSLSHWYGVSLGLLLLLGLGTSGFGTMQGTIVMLVAREDMRGRALGVLTLAIGAGPIGALMVGAIASATSTSFALGLNAAIGIVTVGLVGILMPTLRQRMTAEQEEAQPQPAAVPETARQKA